MTISNRSIPRQANQRRRSRFRLTLGQKRMMWGYIFLLVPFAYLTCVRFAPAFVSLNMSFRKWSVLSPAKPWVGLDNYIRLAGDQRFPKVLGNTLTVAAITVPLEIVVSFGVALLLSRINRFRGVYRLLYFVPFMTMGSAVARVWRMVYAPEVGILNVLLRSVGLPQQRFMFSQDQALYCVMMVMIWAGMGWCVVIMLAGLKQIPAVFYESAQLDGASPIQMLRYITVPLLNPTIVFLIITLTISAVRVFTLVFLMGTAGHNLGGPLDATRTLVLHIYDYGFIRYDMGYASAMTVVMLAMMVILSLVQLRLTSRQVKY